MDPDSWPIEKIKRTSRRTSYFVQEQQEFISTLLHRLAQDREGSSPISDHFCIAKLVCWIAQRCRNTNVLPHHLLDAHMFITTHKCGPNRGEPTRISQTSLNKGTVAPTRASGSRRHPATASTRWAALSGDVSIMAGPNLNAGHMQKYIRIRILNASVDWDVSAKSCWLKKTPMRLVLQVLYYTSC